jgi:hypothetical protein
MRTVNIYGTSELAGLLIKAHIKIKKMTLPDHRNQTDGEIEIEGDENLYVQVGEGYLGLSEFESNTCIHDLGTFNTAEELIKEIQKQIN